MDKSKGVKKQGQDIFDRWNNACKISKQDTSLERLKKIAIRTGGILLMIIFSPLLFIIFVFVVAVSL